MQWQRPPANILLFVVICVAVVAWIASGMAGRETTELSAAPERSLTSVAVQTSQAEPVEVVLKLYGDLEPSQVVRVRSETAGRVAQMSTDFGAHVEPGSVLMTLAMGDRQARLRRAEAQMMRAEHNHQAVQHLVQRGTATQREVQNAAAELEAARAELEAIQLEITYTTLRAPISGIVNQLVANLGDFVSVGSEVVELVDNDPLRVVVQVPQHVVSRVRLHGPARVSLIGGETIQGTVTFIASVAQADTRTFRTHIDIPNPDRKIPSGVSAEVEIPSISVPSHRVSPAQVTLNQQGEIGVFTVDDSDTVVFYPVLLVRSEAEGVWVTGPPETIRLITVRPGFVSPGQRVQAREFPVSGQGGR